MQDLPGYKIEELLHNSSSSAVYRAHRQSDELRVVVKCPQSSSVSARQLTRYRNEFEILKSLDSERVVKVFDLLRHRGSLALVLEEFDGVSLREWLRSSEPSLTQRLEAAIQLAYTLGDVHAAGIIHKDVNSQNVLIDPRTRVTKLIDFGISTRLKSEQSGFQAPTALEGTLAFIAPEQTGRMNCSVDQRADWYSFGITLYELFGGVLPHQSEDPLESVHFHIAGKPTPLAELDRDIPVAVSRIVEKLMQKSPEDRYQSAGGVRSDLERCVEQLRCDGQIDDFDPGAADIVTAFELPQRLYGREEEVGELIRAFERTAAGSVEAMLVAGGTGIGKTSLVREIYGPVTERRGYFSAGTFDQLRQSSPFSALVEALQGLVGQLLTESEAELGHWRSEIEAAIGTNGQLILDVIPMLELIIGPQPPVPVLPGAEAQNRFKHVFKSFVQVFAKRAHPLVLFLDDVQWADSASLNLMSILLSAPETESLLLVQSYRDGDVTATHPLSLATKALAEQGVHVGTVALEPLALPHITGLVADTLHQDADSVAELASIVEAKTGGNPFFIGQFLASLRRDGHIGFDAERQAFLCDVDAIRAAAITDNVAELLTQTLATLPEQTLAVLRVAAAIGRRFDLATLASLNGTSEADAAELLEPAMEAEVVVPISGLESLDAATFDAPLGYRRMQFMHDRLQQAAYELIAADERSAIHLAIGRARLGQGGDGIADRRLFDLVNHMNRGRNLIETEDEKRRLAELNVRAGTRARDSTAYYLAIGCYRSALELLGGESAWSVRRDLALAAHLGLAEALCLNASHDEAFQVIADALEHSKNTTDIATLHALKMTALLGVGRMPEVLAFGREAVESLGVELPTEAAEIDRALNDEIADILSTTEALGMEKLLELEAMEAPEEIALMALLTHCLPAAYQTDQKLFALICCKMVSLSLARGNCPLSARAYGSFGALLSGALGRHADAFRFTQLAVDLAYRLNDPTVLSGVQFLHAMFASHWNEPVERSIELFKQSIETGLEHGDHVHAAYSAARRVSHQQFRGMQLDELRDEAVAARALIEGLGDLTNVAFLEPRIRLIDWLRGGSRQRDDLGTEEASEEDLTREIRDRGNRSFESDWLILLAKQRYLAGEHEQALEFCRQSQAIVSFSAGFVTYAEHSFYYALVAAAVHNQADSTLREELEAQLSASLEALEGWARGSPSNYRHMYLLAAAEQARIAGETLEAMQLYDEAIVEATGNGFVHIEALSAELAAEFWRSRDKTDFSNVYLSKALEAYETWGATGKAAMIRARYGLRPKHDKSHSITSSTTIGGTTEHGGALDMSTALKASQALASEILLDRLVAKMMSIVLENVGGERVVLVLQQEGEYLIEGVKDSIDGEALVMMHEPLAGTEMLSRGIANYVIRTAEHVVLADPAARGRFRNDAYVRARAPKSVLCAPIVHKGALSGLVYLENNQVAGAFTPDRLEALNLLMLQISVSVENATLYARQEQQTQSIEKANAGLAREVAERKAAEHELSQYKDHLEELVTQRTRELESAQVRLVDLSRRSGMAEVAAGVLHNVGNVMNSVNVGAHVVRDAVNGLRIEHIGRVCDQLDTHADRLGEYLAGDSVGRKIPEYLRKLSESLAEGKRDIHAELDRLLEHLEHMKRVIAAQQSYAKTGGVDEICSIRDVIDTALAISDAALRNAGVEVSTRCAEVPPALLDRHRVLQILINLISNAKHALQINAEGDRRLQIDVGQHEGELIVTVTDNGAGISAEHLPKVFNHGFTTKKTGHGFGLHNCANAAQEMGGSLEASSEGAGSGARFELRLPLRASVDAAARAGAA